MSDATQAAGDSAVRHEPMRFRPMTDEEREILSRPDGVIRFAEIVSTSCLLAALEYATKRGWHVFPVPPGTKKSYKSAKYSDGNNWGMTKDPNEVRRDFKQWPDAGIGIPTGSVNGFFVVEADTPEGHGVDGIAAMKALEAQYDPLPRTRMARSPSGSIHWYFKHPGNGAKIKNSASGVAPGVDVRGDGGMVVGPPTVRTGKGAYEWLNDYPIADAPTNARRMSRK
jgi:Bifunctional DNA primase/polymerase, N-terminal